MRHPARLALIALALAAAPAPGLAAATGWTEIGPGSRLRLVSEDRLAPDGTTRLGIEIELAPGTRTYWRTPGEAGLPLEIDLAGSAGIAAARIDWPYPRRETSAGYLDYVYYGEIVLPLTLTLSPGASAPVLRAALTLGVCSDICIPARAEFELGLDFARPDAAQGFRIAAALADVPLPDPAEPAPFGPLAPAPDGAGLLVAAEAPAAVAASLIVDSADPAWLFGPPQNGPHSGLLELPVLAGGDAADLVGAVLRLTYMTDLGPYELTLEVGPTVTVDSASAVE